MASHGFFGGPCHSLRITHTFGLPFSQRPALRQIAVNRIMGGGLVRDTIGFDTPPDKVGENIGRIAKQGHRQGFFLTTGFLDQSQGFIKVFRLHIDIARA